MKYFLLIFLFYYFENKKVKKTFKKNDNKKAIILLNKRISLFVPESNISKTNEKSIFLLTINFPMKDMVGDIKIKANYSTDFFILILSNIKRKIVNIFFSIII